MTQDLFSGESDGADRLRRWVPDEWPVASDWQDVVSAFLNGAPGQSLAKFVDQRCASGAVIYPPSPLRALELTSLAQTRVVILGQDPYHGVGQAHGLAFSVVPHVRVPPSLRNIFKELEREGFQAAGERSGSLLAWARQGVLLLNTCLTVEHGRPASHANQGWEAFTDAVLRCAAQRGSPLVFMLWGAHAQKTWERVRARCSSQSDTLSRHLILTSNHPSPLSAVRGPVPFLGNGHFRRANDFFEAHREALIQW